MLMIENRGILMDDAGISSEGLMRHWSQEEAIAFECAREVITDMMAIQTGQIADENAKAQPDAARLALLRAERSRLSQERADLHVGDRSDVARIRAEYGAIVRAWRAVYPTISA
jgi:hypothetical protein